MSKRRGFTLTEIVVVIALTSLVLAMVGGCLYFVSTYSGTLISKSEELTKLQTIETYLRGQVQLDQTNNKYINNCDYLMEFRIDENGDLIHKENDQDNNQVTKAIIKNTGFEKLEFELFRINDGERETFSSENNIGEFFLECKLTNFENETYTFILGIVENPEPHKHT